MSFGFEYTMEIPGGLIELPDILTQRILAEGYTLDTSDPGKCIFKRNCRLLSRARFTLEGGTWDEAPSVLTVSYIPAPKTIEVRLTWEYLGGSASRKEQECYAEWCRIQCLAFLKHVNKWLA